MGIYSTVPKGRGNVVATLRSAQSSYSTIDQNGSVLHSITHYTVVGDINVLVGCFGRKKTIPTLQAVRVSRPSLVRIKSHTVDNSTYYRYRFDREAMLHKRIRSNLSNCLHHPQGCRNYALSTRDKLTNSMPIAADVRPPYPYQ